MPTSDLTPAIATQIKTLAALAATVAEAVREADNLAEAGNRNGAIGTLLSIEETLDSAQILLKSTLTLHRLPRP